MTVRRVAAGALTIFLAISVDVGAVCGDSSANGRYADVDAATAVFEGVVVRIEHDASGKCSPDRVVFAASRVWKGTKEKEYSLLQATDRIHPVVIDGQEGVGGCAIWIEQDRFELGRRYIVFASGSPGHLESMGCGSSSKPMTKTRRRLDSWTELQRTKSRTRDLSR